jgi:predicted nucleic acid-binding protein
LGRIIVGFRYAQPNLPPERAAPVAGVVLDSSVVLSWCLPDEGALDPDDVQILVAARGAIVPGHWSLEVANVLLMAERRGRIDARFRRAALDDLALLPIALDIETPARAWTDISGLAETHRLTVYDAAYLELAGRSMSHSRRWTPPCAVPVRRRGLSFSEPSVPFPSPHAASGQDVGSTPATHLPVRLALGPHRPRQNRCHIIVTYARAAGGAARLDGAAVRCHPPPPTL